MIIRMLLVFSFSYLNMQCVSIATILHCLQYINTLFIEKCRFLIGILLPDLMFSSNISCIVCGNFKFAWHSLVLRYIICIYLMVISKHRLIFSNFSLA